MLTVSAHILSSLILIGGSLAVPLMAFATYFWSGASFAKSAAIAGGVAVWGLLVFLFAGYWQAGLASPTTVWVLVVANFIWPSVLVVVFRDFFVGKGLSLTWLTLPQTFRYMGLIFILEHHLGHTGLAFAYTAGFGDLMAAVIATTLMLQLLAGDRPGKFIFYVLVAFGTGDFLVAYMLSFLSTGGHALNVLAEGEMHLMSHLPLALLPYFLVPFAMAYHTMMFLTLRASDSSDTG